MFLSLILLVLILIILILLVLVLKIKWVTKEQKDLPLFLIYLFDYRFIKFNSFSLKNFIEV